MDFLLAFLLIFVLVFIITPVRSYQKEHNTTPVQGPKTVLGKKRTSGYDFVESKLCHQNQSHILFDRHSSIFPPEKRDFLRANEEASNYYVDALVRCILFNKDWVTPFTNKRVNPFDEYNNRFSGLEREYYRSHPQTYKWEDKPDKYYQIEYDVMHSVDIRTIWDKDPMYYKKEK